MTAGSDTSLRSQINYAKGNTTRKHLLKLIKSK